MSSTWYYSVISHHFTYWAILPHCTKILHSTCMKACKTEREHRAVLSCSLRSVQLQFVFYAIVVIHQNVFSTICRQIKLLTTPSATQHSVAYLTISKRKVDKQLECQWESERESVALMLPLALVRHSPFLYIFSSRGIFEGGGRVEGLCNDRRSAKKWALKSVKR